nr:reverse transcriptase domain-containing protein [Tanacetum cinerariifolium]
MEKWTENHKERSKEIGCIKIRTKKNTYKEMKYKNKPNENLMRTNPLPRLEEGIYTPRGVDGSGAGLILTNPDGVEFTYALRFQFAASNNEAEYEALIVAKEDNMIKYLDIAKGLVSGFKTFSICQVSRNKNKKADALSKIASTSFAHLSKRVLVEVLETKSITAKEVTAVIEEEGPTWMTELVNYLKEGTLLEDEKKAQKFRLKSRRYELMEGILYKRSFLTPWLRCVGPLQAEYVMREIHEGSCSMHAGPRPDDRTGDSTDASLLYKPCVTRSGTKLLTDGKAGVITGHVSSRCGRTTAKWSIMLGEHNITYRPRTSIKGKILADILNEIPSNASQGASVAETQEEPWTLFTDGSSCVDGSGAGLILTNPDGVEFTYALRFQFAASNNEAEYEALIVGLRIAMQMGVKNIQANVDSKLVANQVLGTYIAKEDNMIKYLDIAKGLVSGFKTFLICQVSWNKNKKADALSKIASTSFAHLSKQVLVEVLETKSMTAKEVTAVIGEEGPTWMTELVNYLKEGTLPEDEKKARKLRLKARQYELMKGILYKRSFLTPWLRCVGPLQAEYVMR